MFTPSNSIIITIVIVVAVVTLCTTRIFLVITINSTVLFCMVSITTGIVITLSINGFLQVKCYLYSMTQRFLAKMNY